MFWSGAQFQELLDLRQSFLVKPDSVLDEDEKKELLGD